tara:strand:- start:2113 stop:2823 length:711 start_codon:yes stop_codon:yes gene_type:complete
MKYTLILIFSLICSQVHFVDLPDSTGVYQPIIIENCLGLDIGDEIGLFDLNGLISSDCSDNYSELLVGSGVYNGNQLTITSFGSIDYCDFENGYQLPGWIGGHDIYIKVWDASSDTEFVPEVNYITGSGQWGDIFTVIDELVVNELSIYSNNHFKLFDVYPNPFNSTISIRINEDLQSSYKINIFDLNGKLVDTIDNKDLIHKNFNYNASNLISGIYLVNFTSKDKNLTKTITLIK